jgi:hypothetical protein
VRGPGEPPDSLSLLIVDFPQAGSCRYWCARRMNAWSYKAALDGSLGDVTRRRGGPSARRARVPLWS